MNTTQGVSERAMKLMRVMADDYQEIAGSKDMCIYIHIYMRIRSVCVAIRICRQIFSKGIRTYALTATRMRMPRVAYAQRMRSVCAAYA